MGSVHRRQIHLQLQLQLQLRVAATTTGPPGASGALMPAEPLEAQQRRLAELVALAACQLIGRDQWTSTCLWKLQLRLKLLLLFWRRLVKRQSRSH